MLVERFLKGFLFFEEGLVLCELQMPEMLALLDFNEDTVRIAGEYITCLAL